ncbi:MAG: YfiR family protein [Mariprofundaceae bacterium]|nr:YfiR family protein [Mariprofundaceae bacterium]
MLCVCLTPQLLIASESTPTAMETDVKAVYVYNFIRFTEWPDETSTPAERKLLVLGNLTLLKTFKHDAFRLTAKNTSLYTHSCPTPACIKESHALFIDRTKSSQLIKILASLKNRPVLTISDIPGFADKGGMIELKRDQEHVIFRINIEAIKQANLYVSAQLLELAEITGKKP